MDTSKEYVLMCEKAEEIQKIRKHGEADYYGDTLDGHRCWLPRQDQLQEMIISFGHGHQNSGILIGVSSFSYKYRYDNGSMEQLWLAFVMKEKYQKTWNGKEWVKNQ